jgi:hypothetical protein
LALLHSSASPDDCAVTEFFAARMAYGWGGTAGLRKPIWLFRGRRSWQEMGGYLASTRQRGHRIPVQSGDKDGEASHDGALGSFLVVVGVLAGNGISLLFLGGRVEDFRMDMVSQILKASAGKRKKPWRGLMQPRAAKRPHSLQTHQVSRDEAEEDGGKKWWWWQEADNWDVQAGSLERCSTNGSIQWKVEAQLAAIQDSPSVQAVAKEKRRAKAKKKKKK